MKYKKGVIKALKEFKSKKCYKHNNDRKYAMKELIACLSEIYHDDRNKIELCFVNINNTSSGCSHCVSSLGKFILFITGRMSLITLLHEFAHTINYPNSIPTLMERSRLEKQAQKWSVGLFKCVYPKQFKKLVKVDDMYCKREN